MRQQEFKLLFRVSHVETLSENQITPLKLHKQVTEARNQLLEGTQKRSPGDDESPLQIVLLLSYLFLFLKDMHNALDASGKHERKLNSHFLLTA